ncbi:hypothetical protein ABVT39_014941 [Epinephelus coioides]
MLLRPSEGRGFSVRGCRDCSFREKELQSLDSSGSTPHTLEAHVEYLCSGSSLALGLQGENAVRRLQDVLGQEDPSIRVPSQLDTHEQLLRSGCHLVAGRMSILDNEQRKYITEILNVSSGGDEKVAHLYTAPCVIMALQGEEIVARFNLVLERY